jgi:hypothetical protein
MKLGYSVFLHCVPRATVQVEMEGAVLFPPPRTTKKDSPPVGRFQFLPSLASRHPPCGTAPTLPVRPLCGPRSCGRTKAYPPVASKFLCWSALRGAQGRN